MRGSRLLPNDITAALQSGSPPGRGRCDAMFLMRTRTTAPSFNAPADSTMRSRPALTVETTTLLHLFFGAVCAWLLLKTIPKLYKGRLEAIDNHVLRSLRRPENLSIPIGPKWLPQAAKDITALGSGTTLTIATGILVGFLCLNRRFRATGFLLSSLGSGLLPVPIVERVLRAAASDGGPASGTF